MRKGLALLRDEKDCGGKEQRKRRPEERLCFASGSQQECCSTQDDPKQRIDDENQIAIKPFSAPGQQQTNAIVVAPIHQRMGDAGYRRSQEEPAVTQVSRPFSYLRQREFACVEERRN